MGPPAAVVLDERETADSQHVVVLAAACPVEVRPAELVVAHAAVADAERRPRRIAATTQVKREHLGRLRTQPSSRSPAQQRANHHQSANRRSGSEK